MQQWLATLRTMHSVGWIHVDDQADSYELSPVDKYDGVVYVERTTSARPSANAVRDLAAGERV
jgi:hypothetical protein